MMKKRSSGILMHITSLPSAYGIGDLGPTAYQFADFLEEAGQRHWQILPLNPVDEGNGYSPYSSLSAFAGNPLLISPDVLCHEGYVEENDLENKYYFRDASVDYILVKAYKDYLFDVAYGNFKKRLMGNKKHEYENFCSTHSYWLDDYALFVAIKQQFEGKSWKEWTEGLRKREHQALEIAKMELQESIDKEKFLQFIFFEQWFALKNYCKMRNIGFIGDMPFYVSYDSSDVWSFTKYFNLDEKGDPVTVSGVPPDYFSSTGQLWGTPIFKWDLLRDNDYDWWLNRISHNLYMFDMVRLDHFRAFSAYWEVPAHHTTAIDGAWAKGPGSAFFHRLKEKFPEMPIIAEDLGTIDDDVRELIQKFDMAGMKVLLFAFGPEMAKNPYIPHNHVTNCVVYTGTHDNNTVKGWYLNEANEEDRHQISAYLNKDVNENNVHEAFLTMALMSVGNVVIFPIQDAIGLGQEARMNIPSTAQGNWTWRILPEHLNSELSKKLFNRMKLYDR
jgi:4-alpha-glucanotransferase